MSDRIKSFLLCAIPQVPITRLMLWLSRIEAPTAKNFIIWAYTRIIKIDMSDAAEEDKYAYASLNAFFTRALKPGVRPYDSETEDWLCPVDGAVSQSGDIIDGQIFQAKGIDYSLLDLVGGDTEIAALFDGGRFATLYLSPRDYHRIHMPTTGTLRRMIYLPGRLFSVSVPTVNTIPQLFARNERCVCYFESEQGPFVMVLVGATNVSAMETVWHGMVRSEDGGRSVIEYQDEDVTIARGDEMGRFNLGSTVIILASSSFDLDGEISASRPVRLHQTLGRTG